MYKIGDNKIFLRYPKLIRYTLFVAVFSPFFAHYEIRIQNSFDEKPFYQMMLQVFKMCVIRSLIMKLADIYSGSSDKAIFALWDIKLQIDVLELQAIYFERMVNYLGNEYLTIFYTEMLMRKVHLPNIFSNENCRPTFCVIITVQKFTTVQRVIFF